MAGALERLRSQPLWRHAALLAIALTGLLAVIGTGSSYSADEGAAIIQARSLEAGDGWTVDHPFPEADPGEVRYPLELSASGERGVAPYGKHPLYPMVLSVADRWAGPTGMVLVSVAGTVVAALAAALLSRVVRPGIDRATLWGVGLASPLFFGSYWVIAHSLGAAFVALGVLCAVRASEDRHPRWCVGCVAAIALAMAFRTEAVFVAGAIVVVAAAELVRTREAIWAWIAVAVGIAAVGVRLAEGRFLTTVLGAARPMPTFGDRPSHGFVSDRWAALVQTWLRPDTEGGSTVAVLTFAAALLALVAVWAVRRKHLDVPLLRVVAVAAAAVLVVRAVAEPARAVPGLLPAFPLVWIGLVGGGVGALASRWAKRIAAVVLLAAGGILATQYREGGSSEWGGRYFAILLPLATPLAVSGLARAAERLDRRTALVAAGSVVVGSLALASVAVRDLSSSHDTASAFNDAVERAAATLEDPVIVSVIPAAPRFAWDTFDSQRWLLVDPTRDRTFVSDLQAAGVDRFVLVAYGPDEWMAEVGGLRRVAGAPGGPAATVVEIVG